MINDNAIPHCGLELGCCSRQIPYDLVAHDKMVYQQGRADAIDEFADKLLEELAQTTLLKDGYYLANIIKPLAEQLKQEHFADDGKKIE